MDACDTGIVQNDSLRLDARATIDSALTFYATFDARVAREAALLQDHDVAFVVADAPPLGCAAAAAAGIPSVVVSNFTWDWIYEEYRDELAAAPNLLPLIKQAYGQADAAWRLPIHGGFESFATIIDVPFVARHARHERHHTRAAFGVPLDRPLALVSFGGYGVTGLDLRSLDCLQRWTILLTGRQPVDDLPPGIHVIDDDWIYERGFRYEDLVRAADVVMTKPGYGIVVRMPGERRGNSLYGPRTVCRVPGHGRRDASNSGLRRDLARRSVCRPVARVSRAGSRRAGANLAPRHGWRRRHCGYDRRHAGRSVTLAKCGMRIEPRIPRTGSRIPGHRVPDRPR